MLYQTILDRYTYHSRYLAYSIRLLLLFKISLYSFRYRRTMWSLNQVHTCSRLSLCSPVPPGTVLPVYNASRWVTAAVVTVQTWTWLASAPSLPTFRYKRQKVDRFPKNQSNKTSRRGKLLCYDRTPSSLLLPILLTQWIHSTIEFNKRRTLDQCCCFNGPTVQISRRSVSFVKRNSTVWRREASGAVFGELALIIKTKDIICVDCLSIYASLWRIGSRYRLQELGVVRTFIPW